MTAVLYVHGTGVREPAYSAAFEVFRVGLSRIRPDAKLARCYWGGPEGAQLGRGGISIPEGKSHRDTGSRQEDPDDIQIALWGLLESDPLFELGFLARSIGRPIELPPNAVPAGAELATRARRLPAQLSAELREVGLSTVFSGSVDTVLESAEARDALQLESTMAGEVHGALARAILAQAILTADDQMDSLLPLDGDSRDLLVATMVAQLGGSDRGLLADIGSGVARLAVSLGATRPVERRRFAITRSATLTAGDVVLYLARGDGIRSFIREQIIATSNDNVVIVAHSLGAIAAVDLLATKDRDVALGAVSMLLTFGTQAPLLYELNALPNLEFGEHLPERFPEWVNVFDPRDLLAFTASEVFHGRPQDRIIDNRTPFPRSHSAYLGNKRFYQILDGVLP